jgi:hypothetical protein
MIVSDLSSNVLCDFVEGRCSLSDIVRARLHREIVVDDDTIWMQYFSRLFVTV